MRHTIFLIGYIYFLFIDLRKKEIDLTALIIYGIMAFFTISLTRNDITSERLIDMIFSIAFGLVVYLLSYFSNEGIGLADGMYFVINGFLLSLKENLILFLTGLIVAFVIGMFTFYMGKGNKNMRLPFMPCFLPAIVGYILCTV
ncbi:MAG: prepilin peptidase [Lachnospiraceae bacterium]|nr:prepilin peptidase [Lachnospiraceae bacterium]